MILSGWIPGRDGSRRRCPEPASISPVKQGQAVMRTETALTKTKASADSGPQTSQIVEESMDQFHGILDVFELF